MDILRTEHLIKKYGKRTVVNDVSIQLEQGEIVGLLYDAFHKQYKNQDDPENLKSLNKLCVRIYYDFVKPDSINTCAAKKSRNKYTFAAVTVSHLQIAIALHTSEVFCVIMIIYL